VGSRNAECGKERRWEDGKVRRWEKGKVEKKEGGKKSEVGMSRLRIADCGFEGQRILIKDFRMRIFGYKSE
jgi:hypothetical protein